MFELPANTANALLLLDLNLILVGRKKADAGSPPADTFGGTDCPPKPFVWFDENREKPEPESDPNPNPLGRVFWPN